MAAVARLAGPALADIGLRLAGMVADALECTLILGVRWAVPWPVAAAVVAVSVPWCWASAWCQRRWCSGQRT
jgi:hypothetical protein